MEQVISSAAATAAASATPSHTAPRLGLTVAVEPHAHEREDDDPAGGALCHVCHRADLEKGLVLLFCDGCDVAVHPHCYAVAEVPDGEWFCLACASQEKRADPQWQPRCILCPVEGGAFMRVYDSDGKAIRSRSGVVLLCHPKLGDVSGGSDDEWQWAHAACAVWIQETTIQYPPSSLPVGVYGVDTIPADRWHLVCSVCDGTTTSSSCTSACTQCWEGKCTESFHLLCARSHALPTRMEKASGPIAHADGVVEDMDESVPVVFCHMHRDHKLNVKQYAQAKKKQRNEQMRRNRRVKPFNPHLDAHFSAAYFPGSQVTPEWMQARAELNAARKRKATAAAADSGAGKWSPRSVIMIDCDEPSSEADAAAEPGSVEEEREETVLPSPPKRTKPSPTTRSEKSTPKQNPKQSEPLVLPAAEAAAATTASSNMQATPSILQPAVFAFGSIALGMKVQKRIPKKVKAAVDSLKLPAPAIMSPVPSALSPAASAVALQLPTRVYDPYSPQNLQSLADASSTADRRNWLQHHFIELPRGHKNFAIFGPKFLAEPTSAAVPHAKAGANPAVAPQSGLVTLARWTHEVHNNATDEDEEAQRGLLADIIHSAKRLHVELPSHVAWRAHGNSLLGWLTMSPVNAPSLRAELEELKSAINKPLPPSFPISGAPTPAGPPQPIHGAHAHPANGDKTSASTSTKTSRAPLRKDASDTLPLSRSERKDGKFLPVPEELRVSMSIDVATLAREQIVLVHSNPHAPIPKRGQLKRTSELIRIIESHGAEKAIKKVAYAPGTIPWLLYEPRTQVPATASAHAAIVRPRLRAQFKSDAQLCTWQAAPDESHYSDSDDDDDDCDMAPDVKRLSREERHALKSRMRQEARLAGTFSSAAAAPSVNAAGLADSASVVASQASVSTSAAPSASFSDMHDIESIDSNTAATKLVEPSAAEQPDSAQPTPPAATHGPTASASPVSATDVSRASRQSHAASISSHFPSQKPIAQREPERREREQRESRDRQRDEDVGRKSHHNRDRVTGQDWNTRREQDRDRHSSRDQQRNKDQDRDRQRDHSDRHREFDRRDDRSHQERRLREHEEEERDRDRRRPSGSDSRCHRHSGSSSRSRSRSRSRDRQRDRDYDRDRDRRDFAHREYGASSRDRSHTYQRSASPSPAPAARTVVLARAGKSSFTIGSGQAHGGPVRHCPRGQVHAADR